MHERSRTIINLLTAITILAGAAAGHAGETYRWTDQQGNVHYGDTLPPGQSADASDELDEQGTVVRERRTEDRDPQAAARREQEANAAQARAETRARDRILVDSFANEQEIMRARDRRLRGIDSNMQRTKDWIANLEANLEQLRQRAARFDDQGKPLPPDLKRNIKNVQRQLDKHRTHLNHQQARRDKTAERFESALQRMREINSEE